MMNYYLFIFHSTHDAIASKQYLEQKIPIMIMPTLREISSSCGISIRVKEEQFEEAKNLMEKGRIRRYKVYAIHGKEVELIQSYEV